MMPRVNSTIPQLSYLFSNERNVRMRTSVPQHTCVDGLYSKMNLKDVCTVINGNPCSTIDSCNACLTAAQIDASSLDAFYVTHTIDPLGQLFGKSACGTNNFTRYMVYKG